MESRRREFEGALRGFQVTRDELCRTPWGDAPIRHLDRALPVTAGGPTSVDNGQGLCEACNYVKESAGWHTARAGPVVTTSTPTGHRHSGRPPPLPGRLRATTRLETRLHDLTLEFARPA
jgi:hypothetical protein